QEPTTPQRGCLAKNSLIRAKKGAIINESVSSLRKYSDRVVLANPSAIANRVFAVRPPRQGSPCDRLGLRKTEHCAAGINSNTVFARPRFSATSSTTINRSKE